MSDKISMTEAMYQEHNRRAEKLSLQYAEITQALEHARAEGDISDNAGHDIAIHERNRINQEFLEVLTIIENAEVFQGALDTSVCGLFTYVTLEDITNHKSAIFQLVDEGQGRPSFPGSKEPARLSVKSTCGRNVLNKKVGTYITYLDGNLATRQFKIVAISADPPEVPT